MPSGPGSSAEAAGMPSEVAADMGRMSDAATATIPARTEKNLLVATWNLHAFADLTDRWDAGPKDSPRRAWHAVACIAANMWRVATPSSWVRTAGMDPDLRVWWS